MILFAASDRRELEPFVKHWDKTTTLPGIAHWAAEGTWRNREVAAVAIGVAQPLNCLASFTEGALTKVNAICSVGTAGALASDLNIADIVVATSVANAVQTWPAMNPYGPNARTGLVRTSPDIARTREEKQKLSATGAIIVEMEAAGIAQTAAALDVPFYCVRAVSDRADETFFIDFQSFLKPNGTFDVPRLVMNALTHPVRGLGELLRLQRRTALAAQKLGDYLNDCKF